MQQQSPLPPDLPPDLINTSQAARLVPNPRGRASHVSKIIRWILQGRIRGWRNGRWWLVSRAEVLSQIKPVQTVAMQQAELDKDAKERAEWVQREKARWRL